MVTYSEKQIRVENYPLYVNFERTSDLTAQVLRATDGDLRPGSDDKPSESPYQAGQYVQARHPRATTI